MTAFPESASTESAFVPKITRAELFILPVSLVAACILQAGGPLGIVAWLAQMVCHEIGHAAVYWARGIPAVPSFGLTQPLASETSYLVFFVTTAFAVWGFQAAWRHGYRFLAALTAVFVLLSILFTLLIPARAGEVAVLYGGLGGELYLGVLAICSFYQRMPRRFNWGVNRYLFLSIGVLSFAQAVQFWYRVKKGLAQLPMGGLFDFGGAFNPGGESMGDIDRLIREFGWTPSGIVFAYTATTLTCIAALLLFYSYLWYRELSDPRAES